MRVLDLCAGTGSATQAFKDRGHDVTTLDISGDSDIICDVRTFQIKKHYHFIWASPPCTELSLANYKLGKCKDRKPDLSIVYACLDIIKKGTPEYHILENPAACLKYFIGKPQATIRYSDYGHYCQKPTDLWGNFPVFSFISPNDNTIPFSQGVRSPGKRAEIPYKLSLAVCLAIEGEI